MNLMYNPDLNKAQVRDIVGRALQEDVGTGDITTLAVVPSKVTATAAILAKQPGVICGLGVAREVFTQVDPGLHFEALVADGVSVVAGQEVARISGSAAAILTGERVALNFLQRLSGISTMTARFVAAVAGTRARIVDTRKTTPGLRILEKYAVRVGGGFNHRFGLYDAILIKDNHIALAGGVAAAVAAAKKTASHAMKVEVEVQDLKQLDEALGAGAEVILLDNMEPAMLRETVARVAGRAILEASGGITADNLAEVARTGVDLISIGALTHSVKAMDLSLEVIAVESSIYQGT